MIVLCCSPEQARDFAAQMFGQKLVTKQTGAEGQLTSKVRSRPFL